MTVRDLTILGCASQQPTRIRNHGGYIVRWNGAGLLFDPGEGTQRQFIFANIAPTCVTRIFISHFHGDHCLGLGSMLMRLNLDKVQHPIHCYYPASGKVYFDRLRFSSIYHEVIKVVEHPVTKSGLVEDGDFRIEAEFLSHGGIDNIGWRITEPDTRKFDPVQLKALGVQGPGVRELESRGVITIDGRTVSLDEVSRLRKGDTLSVAIDTVPCPALYKIAQGARLFLCESTYLDKHKEMAFEHHHLTARQAAEVARDSGVDQLVLTHFSARYQDLAEFAQEASAVFPNTFIADDLRQFCFPKH
ncbi:MAG: ribonuclease Z [Chlamydiae bacterium]|nr:ribonuclease Z [Chlamydiota bacterium]